jgi:hypothetical protein
MSNSKNIDDLLQSWNYDPDRLNVRICKGNDGREILLMRIDMGVLQLETNGRPDGSMPGGSETYLDHLVGLSFHEGGNLVLDEEQCYEVDREFVQFYHRRICWLQLNRFDRAVRDADHTLNLMDFCRSHSPDDQWTMSHEQYRPFVTFHRIQAAALAKLEENGGPEVAIEEINRGLEKMQTLFEELGIVEHFDDDELVKRLIELREDLRDKFEVGRTLQEQLDAAVASEQYELAARLRDELARRFDKDKRSRR